MGLLGKFELLSADLLGVLLDEVDANFVVDERDDHAIVERNQSGGLVVGHLPVRLHEHKGAVGGGLVLAALRNVPTFLLVVGHVAMVRRHSLQLNLHFTLKGTTD